MLLYFQLKESNPYIGNPNYEVVVSDFNFDLHDLNKDKVISKTEFARSEMVSQEEVDSLFSFVDANGKYICFQYFNIFICLLPVYMHLLMAL